MSNTTLRQERRQQPHHALGLLRTAIIDPARNLSTIISLRERRRISLGATLQKQLKFKQYWTFDHDVTLAIVPGGPLEEPRAQSTKQAPKSRQRRYPQVSLDGVCATRTSDFVPHCRNDVTRYAWRSVANYCIADSCLEIIF